MRLRDDFKYGLDRVAFAEELLDVTPDEWQAELLSSESKRVLLNCSRQSGKSTMASILALHQALYHRNSLVLLLAPALRQASELMSKLTDAYHYLGEPKRKYSEKKLS